MKGLSIFKFRAEALVDIGRFLSSSPDVFGAHFEVTRENDELVVLFSTALSLEEIRALMWSVPDGHVMAQTLAIGDQYTGERNYELEPPPSPKVKKIKVIY